MLQAVSNTRDAHTLRSQSTHASALTAARDDGKKHLLLAATGSVATIKLPEMARSLSRFSAVLSVRIILTAHARRFLAGQSGEQPTAEALRAIPGVDAVYEDADEWRAPGWTRGAAILHIELRRWADLLVVAPLSANSLAKIAHGLCDDLLGCVVRAWDARGDLDGRRRRIIVAPAMNTAMWRHPITASQIRLLEKDWGVEDVEGEDGDGWFEVVRPVEKTLACGDTGDGAMQDWREIVKLIERRMKLTET